MDQLQMILHSPVTYIVLEGIAFLVLLFFVMRWSKEQKQWRHEQEEQKKKDQEEAFLQRLANDKRRPKES